MSKFMFYFSLIYLCSDVLFTCSQQSFNDNINIKITGRCDYAGVEIYKRGNIIEMIDLIIIETCPIVQASRCIHVGLLCTQDDPSLRPSISAVHFMLSYYSSEVARSYKSSGEFFQPKNQVHQYQLYVVKCSI